MHGADADSEFIAEAGARAGTLPTGSAVSFHCPHMPSRLGLMQPLGHHIGSASLSVCQQHQQQRPHFNRLNCTHRALAVLGPSTAVLWLSWQSLGCVGGTSSSAHTHVTFTCTHKALTCCAQTSLTINWVYRWHQQQCQHFNRLQVQSHKALTCCAQDHLDDHLGVSVAPAAAGALHQKRVLVSMRPLVLRDSRAPLDSLTRLHGTDMYRCSCDVQVKLKIATSCLKTPQGTT
jgi:hypothetical protein